MRPAPALVVAAALLGIAGAARAVVTRTIAGADAQIEANQASAQVGENVSRAGDVNGDGYDDVIIGAYAYDDGQTDEGAALVFHGGPGGIASGTIADADAVLEPNVGPAGFGYEVSDAGDVNNDGYDDVIVGAPGYNGHGAAFVYHGSAAGIVATPAATIEASVMDGFFGGAVAGVGDVNGDGYDDVAISALGIASAAGAAYIFHGSASGITATTPAGAATTLLSAQSGATFGFGVDGAQDLNQDGFDDVFVLALNYDDPESDEGVAFLYYGGPGGVANGGPNSANARFESNEVGGRFARSVGTLDVNRDGWLDVAIGSVEFGTPDAGAVFVFGGGPAGFTSENPQTAATRLLADQTVTRFGASVSDAGDFDGDGYADLLVGSYLYDTGQTDEGAAFLYRGGPFGIANGGPATATLRVDSNQALARLGFSSDGAGDVDGDGYADLILAAPLYDDPELNEGAVFIELGEPLVVHSIPALPALGLALLGASVALLARRSLSARH